MNECYRTKKLIDEADRSADLPPVAERHVAGCPDCERFADERASLRLLLASMGRVTAPPGFDVALRARLADRESRRGFLVNMPAFARIGLAAAAVLVIATAIQLATAPGAGPVDPTAIATAPTTEYRPPMVSPAPPAVEQPVTTLATTALDRHPARRVRTSRTVRGSMSMEPQMVIVRRSSDDFETMVPTVSVGAQPLLAVSATRQPVPTRASF